MIAGLRRGWIELRQSFTNGSDLWNHIFWPGAMLVVLYFMRDSELGQAGLLLGTMVLPSILGMYVALHGVLGMTALLTVEREDGTLLRAKATPNGMTGYFVGKVVLVGGWLIADLAIVLIPGSFIVDELALGSAEAWLTLVWVLVLGTLAVLPYGAILGSLTSGAQSQALVMLPVLGLIAISGIFYPVTSMPGWLQGIAQVFPVYWLGLGMRSAVLPDAAVAVEIGASWRHLETVGVLGAWAVIGLILAPVVLRRMTRRESGSRVAERREKALQRLG